MEIVHTDLYRESQLFWENFGRWRHTFLDQNLLRSFSTAESAGSGSRKTSQARVRELRVHQQRERKARELREFMVISTWVCLKMLG